MASGMYVVIGWIALVILSAMILLIWGMKTGQFNDVEEAKYRMLEDKEPEPWPGREERKDSHMKR